MRSLRWVVTIGLSVFFSAFFLFPIAFVYLLTPGHLFGAVFLPGQFVATHFHAILPSTSNGSRLFTILGTAGWVNWIFYSLLLLPASRWAACRMFESYFDAEDDFQ